MNTVHHHEDMDDNRISLLRDAPVHKAVNSMAMPAIIGLLVMAIYNVVDTMFVAWLGTDSTAATQVVMPVMMLVSAVGLAIGIGGGGYISRLLGAKQYSTANEVGSVSIFLAFITGLLTTCMLAIFLEPILIFFGATSDVLVKSKKYGFYIVLGSLFMISNMTMNNLLRGDGSAKNSMIAMAIGTVINIILDPIFIFLLDLGISGAAMATTLSQGITFTILLFQYIKKKSVIEIGIKYIKPSKSMAREIMKIGVPTFIRQLLFSISIGILNQSAVIQGGDNLLAAVGLVFKITMVPMYVLFGLGQGLQPVVGYNFGANRKLRVKQSLRYTLLSGFILAVVSALLLIIFNYQLLSIFRPSHEVRLLGERGLFYMSFALIIISINNTISVYFQSIGKGKQSIWLALSRQGIFFIPLCFIVPKMLGSTGVLLVQPIADIFTICLSTTFLIVYNRKHHKMEKENGY